MLKKVMKAIGKWYQMEIQIFKEVVKNTRSDTCGVGKYKILFFILFSLRYMRFFKEKKNATKALVFCPASPLAWCVTLGRSLPFPTAHPRHL
jgi:hypothetical protein